jgi:hypothetical protein
MEILFVSMDAFDSNTSATIQNKGIVRGLSAIGHEVDIMTLEPDHNSISFDESMNDINKLVKDTYYININQKYAVLRAKKQNFNKKTTDDNKKNLLKLIFKKTRKIIKGAYDRVSIFDAQKVNVKGVSKIRIDYSKYDIIISSSDPKSSHLIAERIFKENKNCKAKWIQYWGDPMLNDITRKSDWRDGLVKYHENKLISKADKVVYASPFTLELQKETFPKLSFKMDYANQVYANILDIRDNDDDTEKNKKTNGSITVGYFGAYQSKVRNIIPLYNAVRNSKYKLNVCGTSDVLLKNTNNISIHGKVSYKLAVEMEEESDILVCICNNKGTQIPGKIYYCTAYNKPIIVILDGEYKNELKTYLGAFNRFILCENEEGSIRDAIEKAKDQLEVKRFEISEQLTPKYMANKILSKLEK